MVSTHGRDLNSRCLRLISISIVYLAIGESLVESFGEGAVMNEGKHSLQMGLHS